MHCRQLPTLCNPPTQDRSLVLVKKTYANEEVITGARGSVGLDEALRRDEGERREQEPLLLAAHL
jgi:hypothetical protein